MTEETGDGWWVCVTKDQTTWNRSCAKEEPEEAWEQGCVTSDHDSWTYGRVLPNTSLIFYIFFDGNCFIYIIRNLTFTYYRKKKKSLWRQGTVLTPLGQKLMKS